MKFLVHSLALAAVPLLLLSPHASAAKGDLIEPSKVRDTTRISAGQQFSVAFDQRGDRLVNPHRVQGAQARPAVTLNFFIAKKDMKFPVLIISSSYPRIVRYRAAARTGTRREFLETNMLPLNPNIPVYEGWPDPFVELLLFDFHLTNEKPPKSAFVQPGATRALASRR
jgi:hypothetical protein